MVHTLRLHAAPFRRIAEGTQSIEVRLNDEKRRAMHPGDVIMFISRENDEQYLTARIESMDTYPSFRELFEGNDPAALAAEGTPEEWRRMYEYYSPEDEQKYGAVAIKIELL
jgi:ASC-1-like (ASCH) protein